MAVVKFRYGIVFLRVNGGSSWCTYYRIIFPSPFLLPIAHYGQMEMTDILSGAIARRLPSQQGWSPYGAYHGCTDDASNEKSGARAGYWRIYSRILGVIGGPVSLFKGLDEMQRWWQIRLSAPAITFCWR